MANVTEQEKTILERMIPVFENLPDVMQERVLWICEGMTVAESLKRKSE